LEFEDFFCRNRHPNFNVGHFFSSIMAVLRQENVYAYRNLHKSPVKKIDKY